MKSGAGTIRPDLVGYPRFLSAAHEGIAGSPDNLCEQDGDEPGNGALEYKAGADNKEAGDYRQPAPVDIRDEAGGDLEDEDGHLEGGAEQNQLQRVEADGLDAVYGGDGEHHLEKQRRNAHQDEVHRAR